MAKLTPKQRHRYARLQRERVEAMYRNLRYRLEEIEAELVFLEAIKARPGKQHVYREAHDAHVKLWGAQIVTRVNLMSGKEYQERRDTPGYMSPSRESYWTM